MKIYEASHIALAGEDARRACRELGLQHLAHAACTQG